MSVLIEAALYNHLVNDSNVTNVISTRVYPEIAPQGETMPYVTFSRVNVDHWHHMTAGEGVAGTMMQITGWAATPLARWNLGETLRESMDVHSSVSFGSGASTTGLRVASLQSEIDMVEPPTDGSEVGSFGVAQTWLLVHDESVPT